MDTPTKTSTATDGGTKFTFNEAKSKQISYTNHRPKDTQNICKFFCLTHRSSISYVTFVSLLIVSYTSLLLHLYSSHRFHIHRFPSLLSGVDFDENFPEGTHALTVVPTTEDKIMISTIVIP